MYNLKNVKITHGGVLILVKLQPLNCTNCTKWRDAPHNVHFFKKNLPGYIFFERIDNISLRPIFMRFIWRHTITKRRNDSKNFTLIWCVAYFKISNFKMRFFSVREDKFRWIKFFKRVYKNSISQDFKINEYFFTERFLPQLFCKGINRTWI